MRTRRSGARGKGRRFRTEQLNWALTLRIAAEFQGYCRSLHDLAVVELVDRTAGWNAAVASTLEVAMTSKRRLDTGNPGSDALSSDFAKVGLNLWPALNARYAGWTPEAKRRLDGLMLARNGIAHGDDNKIAAVAASGYPLSQLKTVKSWNGWMNRLASMMDDTVSTYVVQVFGGAKPW